MAEEEAGKRMSLGLPLFGKSLEADILSEHNAAKVAGPLQESIIRQRVGPSSAAVNTSTPRRRS